jgi:hypothetical protein
MFSGVYEVSIKGTGGRVFIGSITDLLEDVYIMSKGKGKVVPVLSRPGRFTPRERALGTHWIGGWVGPRAVLDAVV